MLGEGADPRNIHLVGNVMIDTLVRLLPKASAGWDSTKLGTYPPGDRYGLVTLHRPSNVDERIILGRIVDALVALSEDIPLVFPVHPRTRKRFEDFGLRPGSCNFKLVDPLGYLDFLAVQQRATLVITDSGGVQEETTFLGIPCLTLRESTERPVTVDMGTNTLVGQDTERLMRETARILAHGAKRGQVPPLWDGRAAERIADIVVGWARAK